MDIVFDTAVLVTILLVSIRFGAVFLLSPLFTLANIPVQFRVLFILGFSLIIILGLNAKIVVMPTGLGELLSMAVHELLIGGLFAFGIFAAFGAFLFGGRILDFQMGFGVANLIDPATNTQNPLVGTVLSYMAIMAFFLINGHHMILRGLAYSLEKVPPGVPFSGINLSALVAQFGVMFIYGLAVVAPAVIALLFIDVGMAFAARTMPQVNMFIVGIPLKIFVGLTVLAISINYMSPLLEKLYASIFQYWEQVLG
jgi:flagellar biosynthetic protein FliR